MALTTLEIINNPKLIRYQFATEAERRAIRLKFTMALIEIILNEKS